MTIKTEKTMFSCREFQKTALGNPAAYYLTSSELKTYFSKSILLICIPMPGQPFCGTAEAEHNFKKCSQCFLEENTCKETRHSWKDFFSDSGLKKAKKTHSRWLKKIVIILSISHFETSIAILCQGTRMSFQSCSSFSFSFFLTLPLIASLIQTVLRNYSPKQTVALSGYPTAKKLERPVSSATSLSMPPDVLSKICFKFRAL